MTRAVFAVAMGFLVAGAAIDGGSRDAGLALDGGDDDDAGVVDIPVPRPPQRIHADGGAWLDDGGVTDLIRLKKGEVVTVTFPRPIVLMQCDEPLLSLSATTESLLFTGIKSGHTRCGFWFERRTWPHRTADVTVDP